MSERLRLFVALDLPAHVRAALASWAGGAAPAGVRLVPAERLHLTLAFLGSRDRDEAQAVAGLLEPAAATARALAEPGALTLGGALWLPRRRPAVLGVALEDAPALTALRAELVARLADAIGAQPERRRFTPHVTVARIAHGRRVAAVELEPPPRLTFAAVALTLYRSHGDAGGSRYEPLARAAP